jgi:hypothetical protein
MDHVNIMFLYVEDKLPAHRALYCYIVHHALRYSGDMWQGIYNRIIEQWYVVHELQMPVIK